MIISCIETRHYLFMESGQTFCFTGWSQDICSHMVQARIYMYYLAQTSAGISFLQKHPGPWESHGRSLTLLLSILLLIVVLSNRSQINRLQTISHPVTRHLVPYTCTSALQHLLYCTTCMYISSTTSSLLITTMHTQDSYKKKMSR